MNNKNFKNTETLFQDGFENFEVSFENSSWDKMNKLLDEDDKKPCFIIWLNKQSITLKTLTIMTLLTTLSISVYSILGLFTQNNAKFKNNLNITKNSGKSLSTIEMEKNAIERSQHGNEQPLEINTNATTFIKNENKNSSEKDNHSGNKPTAPSVLKTILSADKMAVDSMIVRAEETAELASKIKAEINQVEKVSETIVKDSITKKITQKNIVLVKQKWVQDQYSTVCKYDPKGPIKDFWLALHYTDQYSTNNTSSNSKGFNFQMMSGNLKDWKDVGIYAGFDWGMQFYGKTPNHQVVINTVNEDSGYTRLRNNSTDFMFKFHLEYAKHAVIPYLNATMGTRLYYTNQKTASYLKLKDNESSSTQNVDLNASLMAGVGAGVRVKVVPRVSIDFRYDYLLGAKTKQVDLQNSSFNGLNYQVNKNTFNPSNGMLRFGIIFDLSEEKCQKQLVTPGHYENVSYDSLVIEQQGDSSIIVLPCNCPCDDKTKTDSETIEPDMGAIETNEDSTSIDKPYSVIDNIIDVLDGVISTGSDVPTSGNNKTGKFPGTKAPTTPKKK